VTATNGAGSSSASSGPTSVVTGVQPPVSTAVPVVSGTAEVGRTLSVSDGSWAGSQPMSFGYQWRRCDASGGACVDIAGATSASYLVVTDDVGLTLRGVVTATNGGGSTSATSAQSAVVVSQPSSGTMTFPVTSGGDDGNVSVAGPLASGYPPSSAPSAFVSGNIFTVARRAAFGNFEVGVGLLRFDTSGLPDGATISSATLQVHVTKKADADGRNLVAEWVSATIWPIDGADFALDSTASALVGRDVTAITTGAVNSLLLTGLSAISTTGPTALRLHLDGGQPSGDNYVQMASLEHNALPEAKLVVSYTLGG